MFMNIKTAIFWFLICLLGFLGSLSGCSSLSSRSELPVAPLDVSGQVNDPSGLIPRLDVETLCKECEIDKDMVTAMQLAFNKEYVAKATSPCTSASITLEINELNKQSLPVLILIGPGAFLLADTAKASLRNCKGNLVTVQASLRFRPPPFRTKQALLNDLAQQAARASHE